MEVWKKCNRVTEAVVFTKPQLSIWSSHIWKCYLHSFNGKDLHLMLAYCFPFLSEYTCKDTR